MAISLILAIARHIMSGLLQVYTLTIFLHMLAHIIVMFGLTLCTFWSLFGPFLLGYINLWMTDGAHKLFGVSTPFNTAYIELYHELLFMFCYIYFPFSFMLRYDMLLCVVSKHLFDLTWNICWLTCCIQVVACALGPSRCRVTRKHHTDSTLITVSLDADQCWNIFIGTLLNKLQWNFNRNAYISIRENAVEKVVC